MHSFKITSRMCDCKMNANSIRKIDPDIAPIQTALGILGMPGMTAYFGLFEVGVPGLHNILEWS